MATSHPEFHGKEFKVKPMKHLNFNSCKFISIYLRSKVQNKVERVKSASIFIQDTGSGGQGDDP